MGDLGSIPGSGRSPGEGNGNPLQYSCLENPRDGGAWWAAVYGVMRSWTQLKRLNRGSIQFLVFSQQIVYVVFLLLGKINSFQRICESSQIKTTLQQLAKEENALWKQLILSFDTQEGSQVAQW